MCPISAEEAWNATDPSHDDETRKRSASAIMAGVAAQDAYLNSRSELEQLKYLSQGPQVVSHGDLNETPTDGVTSIDGTAEEEPAQIGAPGDTSGAVAAGHPGSENPEATIAALRQQIADAGLKPEA